MLLAAALRENDIQTFGLVGAQHRARLLSVSDLESIGIAVRIATDDGSIGHHGYVTDVLADLLSETKWQRPTIYACGPHAMLAAVTKIAADLRCPPKSLWRIGWGVRWEYVSVASVPSA